MHSFINGSLYVDAYTPTGNLGEYTFESGLFNNQNDTGNGAYDIAPGFVIFVTPTNVNTGFPIIGVSQRYVLTSVSVLDTVRVSGTMLWDEKDEEVNPPAPGVFSIISQTTPNRKLAVPIIDTNYGDMPPGATLAALLNDLISIIDTMGGSQAPRSLSSILPITSNGQTQFTLAQTPIDKENAILTVNGLIYAYGADHDFTIEGAVLAWTDLSLVLETSDALVIRYAY
jgi:hypothetical protein